MQKYVKPATSNIFLHLFVNVFMRVSASVDAYVCVTVDTWSRGNASVCTVCPEVRLVLF